MKTKETNTANTVRNQGLNLVRLKKKITTLEEQDSHLRHIEMEVQKKRRQGRGELSELKILFDTYARKSTPPHISGNWLTFFTDKEGKPVLVIEFSPKPGFMPLMRRIPLADTQKDASGENYVMRRVFFGTDNKIPKSSTFALTIEL